MSVVSITLILAGLAAVGLAGYLIGLYNSLIEVRNGVDRAWANIDVMLKQRHDAITKLIEVVKGAKDFEAQTLEKVISARNRYAEAGNQRQALQGAQAESGALRQLFALAESYPDLKSNANFTQLQQQIEKLEEGIADRREHYNESVNVCNTRFEQFPDVFFAGMLGFRRREFFKVDSVDREDVAVKF